MNVLFISSGNNIWGISPIVKAQGESLIKKGLKIDYFLIKGKGLKSYFKHIFLLRKFVKDKNYVIYHAHYSFCGYVAALAGLKPLVVSLMGSDVKRILLQNFFLFLFYKLFWDLTIVKSADMKKSLQFNKIIVLPNGVDSKLFNQSDKIIAKKKLKWDQQKKHILFPANPCRTEKNFKLAKSAFDSLFLKDVELHTLINVPYEIMPFYYNASDVILLTSLWEGSPNVIKESLACNTVVVSTNVGDVMEIIRDIEGCFITTFEVNDVADKLKLALKFNNKINSREKIHHLFSEIIAEKLISYYKQFVNRS